MSVRFSPYVEQNVDFLRALSKTRSEQKKKALLLNATADQILSIVEICYNILKSNFILNNKQKAHLAKHADFYRSIARSRTEKTARRRIQHGGQLALAALVAPVLSALAQTLLDKALHHDETH